MLQKTTPNTRQRLETGSRVALVGVVVNALLAALKISAGLIGHSYALIADGFESILDIFGSLIIWFALRVAAEPPDAEHPYGHGKAEPLAAFIVSLVLIGAAIGLAVQSVREIVTPHHAPAPFTLVVLVAVVMVKEILFRRVLDTAHAIESGAVQADAWHHRSDAVTSAAAAIGISIALIGGPGWESADDWAALVACAFIAWNGVRLLRPALHETMDKAPPPRFEEEVRGVASRVAGVTTLDQCRVRKMGLEYFVDLHVGVSPELTVREGHTIAHAVRDAVRAANPAIADVLVHVEPEDEVED